MLSEAVADYLTEILRLDEAGVGASTSVLAERLQVARPSVTGMLKRLAADGLVEYAPYRDTTLTPLGRTEATAMLRRHRLVETFLVRALGMADDQVHDEAHRWEHAISDEALERMDHWLGRPDTDPHGTAIPAARRRRYARLTMLPQGDSAVVTRVDSRDADHARYLSSLGLEVGAPVTIAERRPFHGPVTIDLAGRRHVVGPEVTDYVIISKEHAS